MANVTSDLKTEIKSLLINALPKENLDDYSIEIVGTCEKGDGYIGDIFFVNLTSKKKNYNFVLKCGKTNEILREHFPVKTAFDNEIYMYNIVFPTFREFEIQRNIPNVFDNPPRCYGTFTCCGREVIVLQNFKAIGYDLWPKESPLPRNHLESILKQFGKWHAISGAMQDQEVKKFKKLVDNLPDFWTAYIPDFCEIYSSGVKIVAELFENDMDEDILNEFKQFLNEAEYVVLNLRKQSPTFNVLTHGDCWSNNFMFKTTGNNLEVAMIDWQTSGFSSPVIDLAYFLYSCISKEDLDDFDDLLKLYYSSFAEHLTQLGSNPEKIYTYTNLLDDWKIYARPSIINGIFILYLLGNEKDDFPDMAEVTENSVGIHEAFIKSIKNVDVVKDRSRHIIEHIVKRGFIKPIKYPQ